MAIQMAFAIGANQFLVVSVSWLILTGEALISKFATKEIGDLEKRES